MTRFDPSFVSDLRLRFAAFGATALLCIAMKAEAQYSFGIAGSTGQANEYAQSVPSGPATNEALHLILRDAINQALRYTESALGCRHHPLILLKLPESLLLHRHRYLPVPSGTDNDDLETAWKPKHNPWVIAVTVRLATIMEVLETSVANVALPHIAGSLGASQDESTWVITSYLVANAIVLPAGAYLGSIVGRKRFYMSCEPLIPMPYV